MTQPIDASIRNNPSQPRTPVPAEPAHSAPVDAWVPSAHAPSAPTARPAPAAEPPATERAHAPEPTLTPPRRSVPQRLSAGVMACLRGLQHGLQRAYAAVQRVCAAVCDSACQTWSRLRGREAQSEVFYDCSETLEPARSPAVAAVAQPDEEAWFTPRERFPTPVGVASLDDVRHSVKVEGIKPIHFAGSKEIDAPLFDVAAVIYDRAQADWVPNHTASRVLNVFPDNTVRGYMSLEAYGKKTDVVSDTQVRQLPAEALAGATRGILCSITSVPSTSAPNHPPVAGHQRVPALKGRFVLRELAANRTRVDYEVGVDTAVKWLPNFIIKKITGNQAEQTLENLAKRVSQPGAAHLASDFHDMFPQFV